MKQSLKYYILIALAVLLHSVTMKAANTSYIIEDPDQDECFISQAAPANRNILERFHFYCTIMPCEMGHADISHVPTDKSFIRPETVFHKYRMRNNPLSDHSIYSHTYNPSDPLTYYVYGLRKLQATNSDVICEQIHLCPVAINPFFNQLSLRGVTIYCIFQIIQSKHTIGL